ncbi:MAG TPA: CBS domain-containing protein [Rubricoccaceae bacterium]|nr:CBS domain-containing protein [Rubricoccaceae bacterium]
MTVQKLLDTTHLPLSAGDTAGQALVRLRDEDTQHLPVVDVSGRLIGLVSEEALEAQVDPSLPLVGLVSGDPVSVAPDTHVFDAAHQMHQHALSVLPVVDVTQQYLGLVERQTLFGQLAHMLATEEPGAIVVLDIPRRDYSLGRLVHLVEQNDVRILSIATEDDHAAGVVRVTLKLNVTDTARVRHLMEHYDYRITAVFDESDSDMQSRIEAFLRYLEV